MENNETFNTPPTIEKVQSYIDKLTDGANTVIKKEKYNEEGLLIELEVQLSEPDAEGNIR